MKEGITKPKVFEQMEKDREQEKPKLPEPNEKLLESALSKVKITLWTGDIVSLGEYRALKDSVAREWMVDGTVDRVMEMVIDQGRRKRKDGTVLEMNPNDARKITAWLLRRMAEKYLELGLQPIEHTIPLNNRLYVWIEGRRFHAARMGIPYTYTIETTKDGSDDKIWKKKCVISAVIDEQPVHREGYGSASPANLNSRMVSAGYIEEMATKRALANALDALFPIGASFEDSHVIKQIEDSSSNEGPEEMVNDITKL